jgi:hypothetical protein
MLRRSRALPGGRLTMERQRLHQTRGRRLLKRLNHAAARKEGARGGTRGSPAKRAQEKRARGVLRDNPPNLLPSLERCARRGSPVGPDGGPQTVRPLAFPSRDGGEGAGRRAAVRPAPTCAFRWTVGQIAPTIGVERLGECESGGSYEGLSETSGAAARGRGRAARAGGGESGSAGAPRLRRNRRGHRARRGPGDLHRQGGRPEHEAQPRRDLRHATRNGRHRHVLGYRPIPARNDDGHVQHDDDPSRPRVRRPPGAPSPSARRP